MMCCFWWFLLGVLLGWLLNWLLAKLFGKKCGDSDKEYYLVEDEPTIDLQAAKAAGFVIKNANDLTVIEGIGPKIKELFHKSGTKTFGQLAKLSVQQMQKVLDDGGSSFTLANPETWAEQAAMARDNRWSELKTFQDVLVGGKRPDKI